MTISPAAFSYVQQLVRERSGLALSEGKEYLVESRLRPIAERERLASVGDLVERLRCGAPALQAEAVEAMATNETYFFRDVHPFESLRTEIIPELLRTSSGGRLTFWSAAASTGQEVYSLAMLIKENFPFVPNITILATDFSGAALAVAEKGIYTGLEINRGLPADLLVKYFHRVGVEWQISDRIRGMVTFRELNLTRPFPPLPLMDVILLRNVLTYFDTATKSAVLQRIGAALRPGGYLILGGSETTYGLDPSYEVVRVGRTVCYKYRGHNGKILGADKWS